MIRVTHCVDSLAAATGGPARTVTALTDALSVHPQCAVELLSQQRTGTAAMAAAPHSQVVRKIATSQSTLILQTAWLLRRLLRADLAVEKIDIIHDHGLWSPSHHYIAACARRHQVPLVLHPRGMLEPWALRYHGWKKKLALTAYAARDLAAVSLFFATSEQEKESIRTMGWQQPIACIPNGVELPPASLCGAGHDQPSPAALRRALFMSRVHPKKGLLMLLAAWANLRPSGWLLRIAGPDEANHLREVQAAIAQYQLENCVEYIGELDDVEKSAALYAAELFILPSYSENFGVVVAEALAQGVPVLTTTGTPWQDLVQVGCGWWVEPSVDDLLTALRQATSLPASDLASMGRRGRHYVQKFSWPVIAEETVAVYRWLLHQGDKPDCVFV